MAQGRKKQEGMVAWWVSGLMGVFGSIAMIWVVPPLLAGDPLLESLGQLSSSVAWLPLLVFGLIGGISFMRASALAEADRNNRERRKARNSWRDTSVNISRLKFSHGWGVTRQRNTSPVARPAAEFTSWSLAALRALEWKRFERLCRKYYQATGFKSETVRKGQDGSFDVKLFQTDASQTLILLRGNSTMAYSVGVKEIRDLLNAMAQYKVARGVYITTGTFNREALNFANDHPLQLLDGDGFLRKLQALPKEHQDVLLQVALKGDYRTPTCVSCGTKMTRRTDEAGPVWGCVSHPTCKNTFAIKS